MSDRTELTPDQLTPSQRRVYESIAKQLEGVADCRVFIEAAYKRAVDVCIYYFPKDPNMLAVVASRAFRLLVGPTGAWKSTICSTRREGDVKYRPSVEVECAIDDILRTSETLAKKRRVSESIAKRAPGLIFQDGEEVPAPVFHP